MRDVLTKIDAEQKRQIELWGVQHHEDEVWLDILIEEAIESKEAVDKNDIENLKEELIQTAAVAATWYEEIIRREKEDGK